MTAGLDIAVSVSCVAWNDAVPAVEDHCRKAAAAAYRATPLANGVAEVSLVLADDALIQSLNRDYREHDAPTNVLAFPGIDPSAPYSPGAPAMLGDVVVAFETAAAEAADENKKLHDHLSHLIVHGMLHLLGHDHGTEAEAVAMERLEIQVLSVLDVADPYADAGRAGGG
jgi:probable rRNA maturation factor